MKALDAEALRARHVPNKGEPDPLSSKAFNYILGYHAALGAAREVINAEPVIEAVPLLPLCKLLAKVGGKPCFTQSGEELCDVTLGDDKCCGINDEVGCWERLLKEWMNNGMEEYK